MKNEIMEIIDKYDKVVIFSGAGVSADSGIDTFRDTDGKFKSSELLTAMTNRTFNHGSHIDLFESMKDEINKGKPNTAHMFAKEIQDKGKLLGVVTQNIDDYYEQVGIDNLVHIHGKIGEYHCIKCKRDVKLSECQKSKKGKYHSICPNHKWLIYPNMVLYGDQMNKSDVDRYQDLYDEANLLIVMGTGLDIIPHRNNVLGFKGHKMLINSSIVRLEENTWNYYSTPTWDYSFIGSFSELLS